MTRSRTGAHSAVSARQRWLAKVAFVVNVAVAALWFGTLGPFVVVVFAPFLVVPFVLMAQNMPAVVFRGAALVSGIAFAAASVYFLALGGISFLPAGLLLVAAAVLR